MVKNPIKVYGRLRPTFGKSTAEEYEVRATTDECEIITFNLRASGNATKNDTYTFRFQKVFSEQDNQEIVFNTVARPVVDSVLQGYNGTMFAYGQTGSGKTYAITGGMSHYDDRGIIPRTIQHIFQSFRESEVVHTTCISYLEIYNECGYDLLNPNYKVSRLDDLPKVTLLEDTSGNLHLRNLSIHPVSSEEEALNLLFLGDTNRVISETPMNPYSSRSHCVFTVHLLTHSSHNTTVRRSKLHIVDLAGSERVHKSGIEGNVLTEARHINLSLHFLEQVIVALAETKRAHVPYRNSMMTTVLRDSLGGNCMTAMLATLSLERTNIEETLSTCRFAQRVALVRNEPQLNEERDPQVEISLLRADVRRLREQIAALTTRKTRPASRTDEKGEASELAPEEVAECRTWVKNFLRNNGAEPPSASENATGPLADPRKVNLCFSLLRDAATSRDDSDVTFPETAVHRNTVEMEVEKYKDIIKQRDSEISILVSLLRKDKTKGKGNAETTGQPESPSAEPTPVSTPAQTAPGDDFEPLVEKVTDAQSLTPEECVAFKKFIADRKNRFEIEIVKEGLRNKFEAAKKIAASIEINRDNMINLHAELKQLQNNNRQAKPGQPDTGRDAKVQGKLMALRAQLDSQQAAYRQGLLSLQVLKVETEHQKHAMEQAKLRLLQNFRSWWAAVNKQPANKEHAEQPAPPQQERRAARTIQHRSNTTAHTLKPRTPSCQKNGPNPVTPTHQLNNLRRYANELQLISNSSDTREEELDRPNPGRALTRVTNTPTLMPSLPHDDYCTVTLENLAQRPRSCQAGRLGTHKLYKHSHAGHIPIERKNRPNSAGTVLDQAPAKDVLEDLPRKLERYINMPRDTFDKYLPSPGLGTNFRRDHHERVTRSTKRSELAGSLRPRSRSGEIPTRIDLSSQIGNVRKVNLTGDPDIDKEIIAFYEARSRVYQNK